MISAFVLFAGLSSISSAGEAVQPESVSSAYAQGNSEETGVTNSAVSEKAAVQPASAADGTAESEKESSSGKIGKWLDRTFFDFDWKVFTFFGSIQNNILNVFFKVITNLGDALFTVPVLIAGFVMALFKKTRKYGIALVFAILIGTLLTNGIFKVICARARPYVTLAGTGDYSKWYAFVGSLSESDNSFPSGHTTAAMEMAVVLFMTFGRRAKRFRWIFPVVGLIVPVSRIYLMVHYPTDVIAGIFIGTLAAVIAYYLMKAVMRAVSKNDRMNNFDLARKLKKKV